MSVRSASKLLLEGGGRRHAKAIRDLEQSANRGSSEAEFNLAVANMVGRYKGYSNREAFEIFLKSAKAGFDNAMFNVGRSYLAGKGVKKDLKAARRWFMRAARLNNAEALFSLGLLSEDSRQFKRAFEFYRKAAKYGSLDGMFNLAWCYDTGTGVKEDSRVAVRIYRKLLPKRKDSSVHFNLARAFLSGRGVQASITKARRHLRIASKMGHKEAGKMLKAI